VAGGSFGPHQNAPGRQMDQASVTLWLSIIGAITAVILATIRIYEFFSARRIRFRVSTTLISDPGMGNTILLLNASSLPAHIHSFDLAWVEKRKVLGLNVPMTRKVVKDESPIEPWDVYNLTIPPHGSHKFVFREADHFDWGKNLKQAIYLRLYVIGRETPIWLWITGPSE